MNTDAKTTKLVFNMGVARALLRKGATIIDLKPSRENTEKTIPVFKKDEIFDKAFAEINDEIAAKKQLVE